MRAEPVFLNGLKGTCTENPWKPPIYFVVKNVAVEGSISSYNMFRQLLILPGFRRVSMEMGAKNGMGFQQSPNRISCKSFLFSIATYPKNRRNTRNDDQILFRFSWIVMRIGTPNFAESTFPALGSSIILDRGFRKLEFFILSDIGILFHQQKSTIFHRNPLLFFLL